LVDLDGGLCLSVLVRSSRSTMLPAIGDEVALGIDPEDVHVLSD
jgi:hypothetical protein